MGIVIFRRVVNVYDIPEDVMVKCIGRGLEIDRHSHPFPMLDVHLGEGLEFNQSEAIAVKIGEGLTFDHEKNIKCKIGKGLEFDCENNISCHVGDGLTIDDHRLVVKIGYGLSFDEDNALKVEPFDCHCHCQTIDLTPDPTQETIDTFQVDSKLSMDGCKLKLLKMYATYKTERNSVGMILGITKINETTSEDEVCPCPCPPNGYGYGGYGYGYGGCDVRSRRSQLKGLPNFYQK